jgi:RIO kinase 1
VRTGNAHGASSSINKSMSVASLPAVNIPKSSTSGGTKSLIPGLQPTDRTIDQLAALAKSYSSRLAKIDTPYVMGVSVNRKGPSATANMKDKSDRATNEQVLDPRTRLILFKMIGRGLIHEVNGCVSTGKEVRYSSVFHPF